MVEPQETPLWTNRIKHSDSTCTQVLQGNLLYTEGQLLIEFQAY